MWFSVYFFKFADLFIFCVCVCVFYLTNCSTNRARLVCISHQLNFTIFFSSAVLWMTCLGVYETRRMTQTIEKGRKIERKSEVSKNGSFWASLFGRGNPNNLWCSQFSFWAYTFDKNYSKITWIIIDLISFNSLEFVWFLWIFYSNFLWIEKICRTRCFAINRMKRQSSVFYLKYDCSWDDLSHREHNLKRIVILTAWIQRMYRINFEEVWHHRHSQNLKPQEPNTIKNVQNLKFQQRIYSDRPSSCFIVLYDSTVHYVHTRLNHRYKNHF